MVDLYVPTEQERQAFESYRVAVLMPSYGYPCVDTMRCLVNVVGYSWYHGLRVLQMGSIERITIHWARENLAREVLNWKGGLTGEPFTHLLWVDDDHLFQPDSLVRLARNAHLDMVSAVYYRRTGPCLPCAMMHCNDPNNEYLHRPLVGIPDGFLYEVDAIGFGFCLMRAEVLERVPPECFIVNTTYGEDVVYCREARKRGVRIFIDGSLKIGHIGPPSRITEDTHRAWVAGNRYTLEPSALSPFKEV
jgi:hypothetical protein